MEYLMMIKPSLLIGFSILGVGFYLMYKYADYVDKKDSKKPTTHHD